MMQKTYLFYDIETTGLSKCFDQVVQFAAIRTDLELNELERHELLIKLNPDVVPSPEAMATHGITEEALRTGLCEYEAICQIHKLLNTPGTISLGYNSLGFDDEFLRFSFYRNLLTPYTHQYANNCSRMDLYPLVVLFYLYKNEALVWPTETLRENKAKVSFKLENLNIANKLASGNAHNAMVDVEATVELTRRLMAYREMWEYASKFFDKQQELTRIAELQEAIMIDGSFGADNNYQCFVLSLGMHNHYKNQSLWLRLDDEHLSKITAETIAETAYVIRKKPAETYLLLPPKQRFMECLPKQRIELITNNKEWLRNNPELLEAIAVYNKEYTYPDIAGIDVDAALYKFGFASYADQELSRRFHAAPVANKANLLEDMHNLYLRQQAVRVLGRNYPAYLPEKYQDEFAEHVRRVHSKDQSELPIDYRGRCKCDQKI